MGRIFPYWPDGLWSREYSAPFYILGVLLPQLLGAEAFLCFCDSLQNGIAVCSG